LGEVSQGITRNNGENSVYSPCIAPGLERNGNNCQKGVKEAEVWNMHVYDSYEREGELPPGL